MKKKNKDGKTDGKKIEKNMVRDKIRGVIVCGVGVGWSAREVMKWQ